jgi:hypothetical protein
MWVHIFLNLQILSDFYFYVAHNTKYFKIKIGILVGYIFDYVLIYFHNFLKLKNMILLFLNDRDHWSLGVKSIFRIQVLIRVWFGD